MGGEITRWMWNPPSGISETNLIKFGYFQHRSRTNISHPAIKMMIMMKMMTIWLE